MADKQNDFFKIEDHFKETENIPSIPVFENHLTEVPRFTIAIPTYKRNKYLREALESAIDQITNEPYEIIVVDNNPERGDDTEMLMTRYKDVKGLSYYKNSENLGMTGNFNRLYTLSRTEWVIMLHDDDLILSDFIDFHSKVIKEIPDADFIYPSFYCSNRKKVNRPKNKYYKLRITDFILDNPAGAPLGMMARKRSIIRLGGFRDRLYPSIDYDLYARAVYNGFKSIKIISSPKAMYRFEVNESLKEETILGFYQNHQDISEVILNGINSISKAYYTQCHNQYFPNLLNAWKTLTMNKIESLEKTLEKAIRKQTLVSRTIFVTHSIIFRIRQKKLGVPR